MWLVFLKHPMFPPPRLRDGTTLADPMLPITPEGTLMHHLHAHMIDDPGLDIVAVKDEDEADAVRAQRKAAADAKAQATARPTSTKAQAAEAGAAAKAEEPKPSGFLGRGKKK